MIIRISQIKNQLILSDEKGDLLRSFEIRENLSRALKLLKQLNSVRTIDGTQIYKTRMVEGISTWSFHQNALFWDFLRDYVKYEQILKFLLEKKTKKIVTKSPIVSFGEYLKINGIEVVTGGFRAKKIRSFFISPFMKTIAIIITLSAFLKVWIFRTAILVYTPDKFSPKHKCDFRFYPVYQYLKEKKINFVEIFHTLLDRTFFKNLFSRHRVVSYLEVFPIFLGKIEKAPEYNLSFFEPHNRKYFQHILRILDWRSQASIKQVRSLCRFLKFTKIKVLLAMDDLRYINEIITACKLNNIRTYGFQHGFLSKYQTGWMNYNIPGEFSSAFDKFFIWNEYWKRAFLPYSTQYDKNNVEVGGPLRKPQPLIYTKNKFKIEKISDLNILVPYETFAPSLEVKEYISRLQSFSANIFFKPRPDVPLNVQLQKYGLCQSRKDIFVVEEINAEVLSKIDAVAGTYSTILNEMIFYEKPIFIFETSFDFGYQLIGEKLAVLLKKDFDSQVLLDYVNNYQSKKNQAWPPVEKKLKETLEELNLGKV